MKKLFLGIPTKLLMLIIGTLLLISIGFSMVSLSRLNQDFKQFKTDTLKQGQAQFETHSGILRTQIRIWLESFADIVQLKEHDDFKVLAKGLQDQFDGLELNYNVKNMWLFNEKQQVLFMSDAVPEYVRASADTTFHIEQPSYRLHCQPDCEQLVTVPLLNKQGDMAVVVVTASLVDIIYSIKKTLQSEIAIISFPTKVNTDISSAKFLFSSDINLMEALFVENKVDPNYVNKVKVNGLQVDLIEKSYFVNLMPLAKTLLQEFYLVLVDDVSPFKNQNDLYRQQFLLSMIIIFSALAAIIYLVTSPFTKRLIVLSNQLPLLARKEFDQFRQVEITKRGFFSDELDILADSAKDLSYELEQLNIEVDQKTKELENIAMFDLLTGLPNRNMLNFQLSKSVANLGRYKNSFGVLFLDLDDFKKVNDSHGHGVGDRLLIEAANRLRLGVRDVDLACRFGGDEFVIALGHTDSIDEAIAVAEDILRLF